MTQDGVHVATEPATVLSELEAIIEANSDKAAQYRDAATRQIAAAKTSNDAARRYEGIASYFARVKTAYQKCPTVIPVVGSEDAST